MSDASAAPQHTPDSPALRLVPQLGTFGPKWIATAAILLAIVALGGYAYIQQEIHGEGITGMRTIGSGGAAWGLYIAGLIFFVGVSFAGITTAAITRLFHIEVLRPLSRAAILLTLTSLAMGAICVLADLGQPLKGLLNLPKFARPMSPFFGDFSLVVSATLFATVVALFLGGRADAARCAKTGGRLALFHRLWAAGYTDSEAERARHRRVSFWLSIILLPLLVVGESTLGFIFGIQSGRPGWFTALAGPSFVLMAAVSGIGVLVVVAAALRRFLGLEDVIRPEAFRWLGNLLMALSAAYLYFMAAGEVTSSYAAGVAESRIAHEIAFGTYAPIFWTVVAALSLAFLLLFVQFVRRQTVIWMTVVAGLLVNVAAVAKRFLIVVPSQTHGMLLPFPNGTYSPTWIEYSVVSALLALGILMYMVFVKIFPIVPVSAPLDAAPERRPSPLRPLLTIGTLAAGMGIATIGLLYSTRFGTTPTSDPALPFAPVVFINGLVLCLLTFVVYELWPDRRAEPAAARPSGEGAVA